VRVPVFNGHANATLNFDDGQNVADGNTVTVGNKVYTFQATLTNVDGHVAIGPTLVRSIYNLVAALNVGSVSEPDAPAHYGDKNDAGEGAGVAYAAAMTMNPANVVAIYGGDYDLQISHWPGGTAGNSIALAETLVGDAAWVEGALVDPVPEPTADQFGTALVSALNNDALGLVYAEKVSASEVLVWSRRPGNVQLACGGSFTSPSNAWEWATLSGGVGREGLTPVAGVTRVVSAAEATEQRVHFLFGFEPDGAVLQVRSGAGAPVSFDGPLTIAGRRVTVAADTVPLAAGQVFNLIVFK